MTKKELERIVRGLEGYKIILKKQKKKNLLQQEKMNVSCMLII